jgi:hypothetical protein
MFKTISLTIEVFACLQVLAARVFILGLRPEVAGTHLAQEVLCILPYVGAMRAM